LKLCVLGCGPAGMIATHSLVTAGHDVTILSRRRKSPTFGAMYLHAPIPGINPREPEMFVNISKTGTREGYAENVYGDPLAPVSWDRFEVGSTPAWSLTYAYDKLWRMYSELIQEKNLTPKLVSNLEGYDKIFTTLPATATCMNWRHNFAKAKIIVFHGESKRRENTMWYNGSDFKGAPKWYRHSIINGYQSWEFSEARAPKMVEVRDITAGLRITAGVKPLHTDCTCHPEIVRIGRFGRWDKNVFTHHGYEDVRHAL
jgi:hypothetical protein